MDIIELQISPISMWMHKDAEGRWTAGVEHRQHGTITTFQKYLGESIEEFHYRTVCVCRWIIELSEYCKN